LRPAAAFLLVVLSAVANSAARCLLLPVFVAFFGLRVIELASAAAVAWQPSGADPEARERAAR
jgi:hypothetical protein